jgi:drug/metabolite transporter (DMT)-like permease
MPDFRSLRIPLYVALALLAFAANSLFCRWALIGYAMDALLFTCIRLSSGALILALLCFYRHKGQAAQGNIMGGFALLAYALCFSLAYTALSTGTGALILFASVQLSLMVWMVIAGDILTKQQLGGMVCALLGLVYLCLPSLTAPPLWAALLMGLAGIAWAVYTRIGQQLQQAALLSNYRHFLLASLLCLPALFFANIQQANLPSILLAIASGALASGLGYALWYHVLPALQPFTAAVLQLIVPLLAALLGLLILGEQATFTLLLASALILGGILLSLRSKSDAVQRQQLPTKL